MRAAILVVLLATVLLVSAALAVLTTHMRIGNRGSIENAGLIRELLDQFNATEIHNTVAYLTQTIGPRLYGTTGNVAAYTYLYNRLGNISGLNVAYQGTCHNVIATLPSNSSKIYVIGAHYDTVAGSPGATDDAGGCAIVLECARIMSKHNFSYTVKFAFWNSEEGGSNGSAEYVSSSAQNTSLYFNYDSSCYDPFNQYILDIMYNTQSAWAKNIIVDHNTRYSIGFELTFNAHTCSSDHRPFWNAGYTAVMTHEETHGPAHTSSDTIDKVSLPYALKNGQLGLSIIAELAGIRQ